MSKKSGMLGVRFSDEDMRLIERVSKKAGIFASTWVRDVVIIELIRQGKRGSYSSQIREQVRR